MSTARVLRTYADGFGTWHAVVDGGTVSERGTAARDAIKAELWARGEVHAEWLPTVRGARLEDGTYDYAEDA